MIPKVPIRIQRLYSDVNLPSYGRLGDAGLDLYSYERGIISPHQRRIFGTGIALAIPEGTVGLVWDRSSMAGTHGITTLAGVLDHTYRGELRVVLLNTDNAPYTVEKGDRIAQLLVQPIFGIDVEEVSELESTVRGDRGFGSTGR